MPRLQRAQPASGWGWQDSPMTDDAASRPDGAPTAPALPENERRGESEFDRGLSFFDAIYGFAATLLIANVDMPSAADWRSWDALMGTELPIQLFGVALSFVVIVAMWRANVRIMRRLGALDGPTVTANLLAAAMVIFCPSRRRASVTVILRHSRSPRLSTR